MGRRSFNSKWLKNSQDEICALDLGADYCAEHEQGIDRLLQDLGLETNNFQGIDSRIIKELDLSKLNFITTKSKASLYFNKSIQKYTRKNPESLVCEWDSRGFLIKTTTPEDCANLKLLHKAFLAKDLAIWIGGAGVFQNGGLILAIPSKVDEINKKTMLEADLDKAKLTKAAGDTGIYDILKSAGKSYLALSPAWKKDDQVSKYEVVFWLNPWNSDSSNYGWFTVEDLISWSQNQGVIVKNKNIS